MASTTYLVQCILFGCSVCFCEILGSDIPSIKDFPLRTLEDGSVIRGLRGKTVTEGKLYYSFRGIPYAKPPIDELRWQPPVKVPKWDGILDAIEDGSQCTQAMTALVVGQEDCLTINVYTPTLEAENLPVIVWIHDAGFIAGNSSYAYRPPDLILDENVIFVSFNYRIGVFGFLSTEDLAAPGNFALKDQVLALEWVQENIRHFGGDPKAVTIFGESVGAVCVSYILQSDSAKGLFRSAIMNSGTSTCLWTLDRRAKLTSQLLGKELKVDTSNSFTMIEQLRQFDHVKTQVAATAAASHVVIDTLAGLTYSPVKEPVHDGAFFYNNSEENFRNGNFHKVPILMGTTSNEAIPFGILGSLLKIPLLQYDQFPKLTAPADLTDNDIDRTAAGNEVYSYFFGSLPPSMNPKNLIRFVSRDQYHRPIRRAALNMKKYVPVFFYTFSFKGASGRDIISQAEESAVGNDLLPLQGEGVGHGEDLGYIFHRTGVQGVTENDILMQKRTVRMWTNFAKYVNPTPVKDPLLQEITWPVNEGTDDNLRYLNIDLKMSVDENPFDDDMRFYDYLYEKYGQPPYDTY